MIFKKIKVKEDDVFKNKLELVEVAKTIFKKNPEMIWYPVYGALLSIVTFVLFIMITKGSGAVVLALIFWYLLFNVFVVFFNTATVACAKVALSGGNPTFLYGIKEAFKRMNLIINWALFDGLFSIIMGLLVELKFAKAFAYAGEIAWSFVKYFIIPIMVFENKSVKDAISESQRLIKKNWGKSFMGDFKVSFISFIPFIIVLLILIFSSVLKDELVTYGLFILTILTFIIGALLNFSLRSIFCTALYASIKGKAK